MRGNYIDADLSVSAAVPVAGTFTGLAKLARKAKKALGKAFSKAPPPKVVSPRTPVGREGQHLGGFDPKKPTNYSSKIGKREFSGHAFDKMQSQVITPSAVENAIRKSNSVKGKYKGTTAYHDTVNNITVITDTASGRVITVSRGIIKQ